MTKREPIKDLLDVHMHTIASGHAYSTIREMATACKKRGMKLCGIADHGPKMNGAPKDIYFCNFKMIPRDAEHGYGIDIVFGAEMNILDYEGSVDLVGHYASRLDYAVASLHDACLRPGSIEQNTRALINAMRHPKVKIIGHPDNPVYPVDFVKLAQAAKENGVLLELNNASYTTTSWRVGSIETSQKMLDAAKAVGAMVVMNSDAHSEFFAGEHAGAQEMIRRNDFPGELVINSSPEAFKAWIAR